MLTYEITSKGLDRIQYLEDKLRSDTLTGPHIEDLDVLRDLTFSPIAVTGKWATPEDFAYLVGLERRGYIQKTPSYPKERPGNHWVFSEDYFRQTHSNSPTVG